jgi:hypothetical protein
MFIKGQKNCIISIRRCQKRLLGFSLKGIEQNFTKIKIKYWWTQ